MPETRKCPDCGAPLPGDSPGGLCVMCGLRGALEAPAAPSSPSSDPTVRETTDTPKSDPSSEKPGDRIGRYKLLQEIGVGGMGSVWMAEQQQPHRRVALKLVKLGMDTKQVLARFSAEQQALALMEQVQAASAENPFFHRQAQSCFVLAMAHHQLNEAAKARAELVSGTDIVQSRLPALEGGNPGPDWVDLLIAHILMREAKLLIEAGSAAAGPAR